MRRHTLALLTLALGIDAAAHSATLPAGFTETATSGFTNPTAMAVSPDGRILVCEMTGTVRVIRNDALLTTPFVTIPVDFRGERGLLGVAFDPDFLTNQYVYFYYTTTTPAIHNRISRFTAAGDVAVAGSEFVVLDLDDLSSFTVHNGGAIHFGRDRKLYAAVGENAVPLNSQIYTTLLGKILRLNSDGTIPMDNPFYGTTSGANRSIWALGLRNPFTFAVHPLSGRIFINDVGGSEWEEINEGVAGGNYGWSAEEGPSTNPLYISPIHYYANADAVECAITGGTFYAPEVRQFPASYADSYFFSDGCAGWIRRLDEAVASSGFATGITTPVDLQVGNDGSLYYLDYSAGVVGRIRWDARE